MKFIQYYLLLIVLIFSVTGCSSNLASTAGYQSARAQASLELPPDLINTTSVEFIKNSEQSSGPLVLPAIEGVSIEGAGLQRYLKVTAPPEQTWDKMLDFVRRNNLPILIESKQEGTLETDWIGDESIDSPTKSRMRSLLGSLAGRYPINDKYKFWLERLDQNNTAVHVEHTKLTEIVVFPKNEIDSLKSHWQESTGNEFQVVEMLRNMQSFFGGQNATTSISLVQLLTDGNEQIILAEPIDKAWTTIARAIKGSGYRLVDINREDNLYVISQRKGKGRLISKFSFKRKLGLKLESLSDTSSRITVTTKRGGAVDREEALPVLYALAGELRR